MNLYLQFGHGMMKLSQELIQSWGGGTVILSPRDLELRQMVRLQSLLSQHNGSVVLDPQFYIPRSDHQRLTAHAFWPDEYQTNFFSRSQIERMLRTLYSDYNEPLNTDFFILPSLRSSLIDDDWYSYNSEIVDVACQPTSKTAPLPTPKSEPPPTRSGASFPDWFRFGWAGGASVCSWFAWLVALVVVCH